MVAVSDLTGCYYNPKGLDIPDVLRHTLRHNGSLAGYAAAEVLPADDLLTLDVDMLIPAALGSVIHDGNADKIKATIVIEAANSPTLPSADQILFDKGVCVLPDILANAGGVTVSYFEWVQNRQHYSWSLDRVRQELDRTMSEAFENVWQSSVQNKGSLRTAAFMLAIQRVQRATELAGFRT